MGGNSSGFTGLVKAHPMGQVTLVREFWWLRAEGEAKLLFCWTWGKKQNWIFTLHIFKVSRKNMLANVTFCLAASTNSEGPGGIYKPMVNFAILLTQSDLCKLLEVMLEPRARQGYGIFSPCACLTKTDSISLGTILLRSFCFQKHLCLHRHPWINNSVHCTQMGKERKRFF